MEIDYISGPKTNKIFGMTKYQLGNYKKNRYETSISSSITL